LLKKHKYFLALHTFILAIMSLSTFSVVEKHRVYRKVAGRPDNALMTLVLTSEAVLLTRQQPSRPRHQPPKTKTEAEAPKHKHNGFQHNQMIFQHFNASLSIFSAFPQLLQALNACFVGAIIRDLCNRLWTSTVETVLLSKQVTEV